ncbi:2OG-Fe(II) oxygenase family protein [Luminiphilus sp.]|nr:2OG-Fe(II) oxygenase family protein [Luminiphilus sp.]
MAFPQVPEHPFWSRASPNAGPDDIKFSGAWSVRLRSEGFHTNHVHPTGWLSGVLYVSVPYTKNEELGGNIQFGAPLDELGTNLKPKRFIEPKVGTLVLFPSYMWHGTIPFHADETRMTIAFDILPIN